MSWAIELAFCMRLGIHKNYKFVQYLPVGVVKHTQSDWKQWDGYISRMNIGMNLTFCTWHIQIHLYNSVHIYIFCLHMNSELLNFYFRFQFYCIHCQLRSMRWWNKMEQNQIYLIAVFSFNLFETKKPAK